MNEKLVESLAEVARSLSPQERQLLAAKLQAIVAEETPTPQPQHAEPILRGAKAGDLLQFAGTWEGDDLEDCLRLVYKTRSQAEFYS